MRKMNTFRSRAAGYQILYGHLQQEAAWNRIH